MIERWVGKERREKVPDIDKFMEEIKAVCLKHNMSISHQDGHGAFEIEEYSDMFMEWLEAAADNRERLFK